MNNTDEKIINLARAILSLTSEEECLALFDDLLTVREVDDLSSRLEVARMLSSGANYIDIAASTGASTATISRVSKCLAGDRGGYRTVLGRIDGTVESDTVCLKGLTEEEAAAVRTIVSAMLAGK